MPIISASLLAIDISNIDTQLVKLKSSGITSIHYDVMDKIFVPNEAFGIEHMQRLKDNGFSIDVHLMVKNNVEYIDKFLPFKPNSITFHCESDSETNIMYCMEYIRRHNIKTGIAIKPNTNIDQIANLIEISDIITVMGVEPGKGGQPYIKETTQRLKYIRTNFKNVKIALDGGVNFSVIEENIDNVDIFISGSFLFKLNDFGDALNHIRKLKGE